jgi:hypothetical protein
MYRPFAIGPGEKAFDCSPMWVLYRRKGAFLVRIFDGLVAPGLSRTLVLTRDDRADLYFGKDSHSDTDPFHGPVMELLMANHLAYRGGLIVHACGIAAGKKGLLFVGHSGAGKSTLARMWDGEAGIEILSDDRVIVRNQDNEFWIHGTPWHGDARFASPGKARLEGVFFLRHGKENRISEARKIEAVSELLSCSFPTYWDRQGMSSTLEMLTHLGDRVPCREMAFRPEKGVLDLFQKMAL